MDARQLMQLALSQAAQASLTDYKGEKVFVLFNGKTEYTFTNEKNLAKVMQAEPSLMNVCCFLNGEALK